MNRTSHPVSPTRRDEGGQVVVVIAVLAVILLGLASIAIDSGIAAADRRDLQSYADNAALAGAAEYNLGSTTTTAHYVALQYLQKALKAPTLPTGCSSASCPGGSYTFAGGYTITIADPTTTSIDVGIRHSQSSFLAGAIGFRYDVDASSGRAEPVTPGQIGATYAVAAVGGNMSVYVSGGGVTGSPTGDVNGPVYAANDYGANNDSHATSMSSYISGYGGTSAGSGVSVCDSPAVANHVDLGDSGNGLDYDFTGTSGAENHGVAVPSANSTFQADAPTTNGPFFASAAAAKDASGNWKPGTYNAFAPNGGKLNAGVYVIKNYGGTISPGTNTIYTGIGQEDPTGAISIVLDATDTGTLDLNSSIINGLDDLQPSAYTGPRDPLGTHNFVIWGGTFAGSLAEMQPQSDPSNTQITGIVYLPNQDLVDHGNTSPKFVGSTYAHSVTIDGGGNGTQVFGWVCGLRAINPSPAGGGLVR